MCQGLHSSFSATRIMAVHLFWTQYLLLSRAFIFFHSTIFIFTFTHSDFMKGYCKMFSAIKTNKLCDSLFKWASSGISLTKVNFTSFSFTGHHFYLPDHKWTTTVLGTVPTSFHRNHLGFSGSFQAAVILFNFFTPSTPGLMLWQKNQVSSCSTAMWKLLRLGRN